MSQKKHDPSIFANYFDKVAMTPAPAPLALVNQAPPAVLPTSTDLIDFNAYLEQRLREPMVSHQAFDLVNEYSMGIIQMSVFIDAFGKDDDVIDLAKKMVQVSRKHKQRAGALMAGLAQCIKKIANGQDEPDDLDDLLNTDIAIRSDALRCRPATDTYFIHPFNFLKFVTRDIQNVTTVRHRGLDVTVGDYKVSYDKDEVGLLSVDGLNNQTCSGIFQRKCEYVSQGKYVDAAVLMFLMRHSVTVAAGVFKISDANDKDVPISDNQKRFMDYLDSYIIAKVKNVLQNVGNLPSVKKPEMDVISIILKHCKFDGEYYEGALSAAFQHARNFDCWKMFPIGFVYRFSELLDSNTFEQPDSMFNLLRAKAVGVGPKYVDAARNIRSKDAVANTVLKDWNHLAPGRYSTYVKWQTIVGLFKQLPDVPNRAAVAMVGCTSDRDWWSDLFKGVTVDRFDKNECTGVNKLDITQATVAFEHKHVFSDVYLKAAEKNSFASDCAAMQDIGKHVLKCFPHAETYAIKIFPTYLDNTSTFIHVYMAFKTIIENKDDWIWDIVSAGRLHNGESFFVCGRREWFVDPSSMFTGAMFSAEFLRYVGILSMGLIRFANDERNRMLRQQCPIIFHQYEETKSVDFSRLPRPIVSHYMKKESQIGNVLIDNDFVIMRGILPNKGNVPATVAVVPNTNTGANQNQPVAGVQKLAVKQDQSIAATNLPTGGSGAANPAILPAVPAAGLNKGRRKKNHHKGKK